MNPRLEGKCYRCHRPVEKMLLEPLVEHRVVSFEFSGDDDHAPKNVDRGGEIVDLRPGGCGSASPKDAAAAGKVPLDLLEPAADELIARVLEAGTREYGLRNYVRADNPVRLRTYVASVRRHVAAILAGEDIDPDSGLDHWAHVGATAHVILAAKTAGSLVDDR